MNTRLILFIALTFFAESVMSQVGNVGINVQVPRAMLHVGDSSVLFTAPSVLSATPGPTPLSGGGHRMMWYADKAAFRAGGVEGAHWDRDSIGHRSFAIGLNTKALAANSFASGYNTTASANCAFASGGFTRASGDFSTSLGVYTQATDYGAFAAGQSCVASEITATAFGTGNHASGYASLAGGFNTHAAGNQSVALNTATQANGHGSTALGLLNIANGIACVSIGAYNDPLLLTGSNQLFTETPLFIVGNGTSDSTRQNAMVVRYDGRTGLGTSSPEHILDVSDPGMNAQVARFSSGGGYGEIVVDNGEYEADFGMSSSWGYAGTKDNINFTIRTGATSRMNFIHSSGNVGIGTDLPESRLHVHVPDEDQIIARFTNTGGYGEVNVSNDSTTVDFGANIDHGFVGTKSPADFYFRTGADYHMVLKNATGFVGIGTATPAHKLDVNGSASKPGGGSWIASSDARLKSDVHDYTDGLDKVLAIRPVTYRYTEASGYDPAVAHIGVVAQELQSIAPYMVSSSERALPDGTAGYLEVDNSAMVYMLINAVKEQQEMIEQLKVRIEALEQ